MKKDKLKLVTALKTGDGPRIAVAKTVLESAGIAYIVKNEDQQELFALGRFGTGFDPIIGPVEIQVSEKDARRAIEFLK